MNVDPADMALKPLRNNGGSTATHALDENSVAVDAIPTTTCELAGDQRGVSRPQGMACDTGAFELDP